MELKDLGIDFQSFSPIPNSVIIGRFEAGDFNLRSLKIVCENVRSAFEAQNTRSSVVFIPSDLTLERMDKNGLYRLRKLIDDLIFIKEKGY